MNHFLLLFLIIVMILMVLIIIIRYARADELGIPFGVTVDFETLLDDSVTVRERDSMAQVGIYCVCWILYYGNLSVHSISGAGGGEGGIFITTTLVYII